MSKQTFKEKLYTGKPSELSTKSIMKKQRDGTWVCTADKQAMRSRDEHTVTYLKALARRLKHEGSIK